MPETTPPNLADPGLEVRTYFIRNRNALLARASLSEMYVDHYLHLATQGMKLGEDHDTMFKRAIAAFVLHCAAQPRNEISAWTINFQQPLVNLFLAGDNTTGSITGRVFNLNVKEGPENLFFADVVRGTRYKRRSGVGFTGADPIVAVERYYAQSEQRAARYFQLAEEEFSLVVEHPDCDLPWFHALTPEQIPRLEKTETLTLLEKRVYRWHCGCNEQRMMEVLTPAMKENPGELFGAEPKVEIRCPRCGAKYDITRVALEAFVTGKGPADPQRQS